MYIRKYPVVDVISVLNVALESVVSGRQEEACSSGYTHSWLKNYRQKN